MTFGCVPIMACCHRSARWEAISSCPCLQRRIASRPACPPHQARTAHHRSPVQWEWGRADPLALTLLPQILLYPYIGKFKFAENRLNGLIGVSNAHCHNTLPCSRFAGKWAANRLIRGGFYLNSLAKPTFLQAFLQLTVVPKS